MKGSPVSLTSLRAALIAVTALVLPGRVEASAAVKAFPTAEGFGANSLGGRGGALYQITTLDDSGTGSLRACIEA